MSQSSDPSLSLTRADRLRKCEDLRIIAEWGAARLSVLAALAPRLTHEQFAEPLVSELRTVATVLRQYIAEATPEEVQAVDAARLASAINEGGR